MPFQYALTRKYSHPYEKKHLLLCEKVLTMMRFFSHHSENTLRKTLSPVSNLNLGEAVRHLFMISVTVISTSRK